MHALIMTGIISLCKKGGIRNFLKYIKETLDLGWHICSNSIHFPDIIQAPHASWQGNVQYLDHRIWPGQDGQLGIGPGIGEPPMAENGEKVLE